MAFKTQIFEASEIDLSRHVATLHRAFQASPWAAEIGATFTEGFYRWKYNTPAGKARIAYAMSGSEPASGVSAFPVMLDLPHERPTRGWQIGDIMTVPEMRGRGLYGKCLSALVESMDDQLLLCFPNDRSRHWIERAGFSAVANVETFVRPLLIPSLKRSPARTADPDVRISEADAAVPTQWLSVRRDRDYFEWRYARHPAFSYQTIGGAEGFAIVRSFSLFGANVGIVMEFHPTIGSGARLLRQVHHWARENGLVASFLMANWFPLKPITCGYVFVPHRLVPKRQILFVRYPGGRTSDLPWRTQIGDWDGL
jgi:GNAT superfamily N-acetyltransferase